MVELLTNTVCPACGKEMRTIYIPEIDVKVDICINGCGGVYFSKKEIWNFDNIKNNIDTILSQFKRKHFTEVAENAVHKCPSCGANMVKFGIAGSNAKMDMCYSCGGRFLDYKELINLCSEEYETLKKTVQDEDNFASRNYYKVLYFSGASSMRQDFEDWVKKYI